MRKHLIPGILMLALTLPLAASIGWAVKSAPRTAPSAEAV